MSLPQSVFTCAQIASSVELYLKFRYHLKYTETWYPVSHENCSHDNQPEPLRSVHPASSSKGSSVSFSLKDNTQAKLNRLTNNQFIAIIRPTLCTPDNSVLVEKGHCSNACTAFERSKGMENQLDIFTEIPHYGYVYGSPDVLLYDKTINETPYDMLCCGPGGVDHLSFCLNLYQGTPQPHLYDIRKAIIISLIASIEAQRVIPVLLTNLDTYFFWIHLDLSNNGLPFIICKNIGPAKDVFEYIRSFHHNPLWFREFLYHQGLQTSLRFVRNLNESLSYSAAYASRRHFVQSNTSWTPNRPQNSNNPSSNSENSYLKSTSAGNKSTKHSTPTQVVTLTRTFAPRKSMRKSRRTEKSLRMKLGSTEIEELTSPFDTRRQRSPYDANHDKMAVPDHPPLGSPYMKASTTVDVTRFPTQAEDIRTEMDNISCHSAEFLPAITMPFAHQSAPDVPQIPFATCDSENNGSVSHAIQPLGITHHENLGASESGRKSVTSPSRKETTDVRRSTRPCVVITTTASEAASRVAQSKRRYTSHHSTGPSDFSHPSYDNANMIVRQPRRRGRPRKYHLLTTSAISTRPLNDVHTSSTQCFNRNQPSSSSSHDTLLALTQINDSLAVKQEASTQQQLYSSLLHCEDSQVV